MAKTIKVIDEYNGRRDVLTKNAYNHAVVSLAQKIRSAAAANAAMFPHGKKTSYHIYRTGKKAGTKELKLATHVSFTVRSKGGELSGIIFQFPLHGVYLEYGVGRRSRSGLIVRTPSDWFSREMKRNENAIADTVAQYHADLTVRTFMELKKQK